MAFGIQQSLRSTKLLVHILVCVFAMSSWVDLNGMWVELPLLVLKAPENWTLPSYITIIAQVANIGPLIFVLVHYFAPYTKPRLEKITSFIIIGTGILALVLLAFFWDKTTSIGGVEHSGALFGLNFLLATGDCTSSVSYYAFMSLLKPEYMASLMIGEGFSGMVPALIALGQGAGDIQCVNKSSVINETFPNGTSYNETVYKLEPEYIEPRFSVRVFFLILAAMMCFSGLAFFLLNSMSYCLSEMVCVSKKESGLSLWKEKENYSACEEIDSREIGAQNDRDDYSLANGQGACVRMSDSVMEDRNRDCSLSESSGEIIEMEPGQLEVWKFISLQLVLILVNMTLTSFLSTIQIYSTLPYGLSEYHLATTLSQVANPVACFGALWLMAESLVVIGTVTALGMACVVYIIYLAALSPEPPLLHKDAGGPTAVMVWVLATLFLVYAKVCVAGVMRKYGRNNLIWAGVFTQVGSFIGAVVGFLLVTQYGVFVQAPFC